MKKLILSCFLGLALSFQFANAEDSADGIPAVASKDDPNLAKADAATAAVAGSPDLFNAGVMAPGNTDPSGVAFSSSCAPCSGAMATVGTITGQQIVPEGLPPEATSKKKTSR